MTTSTPGKRPPGIQPGARVRDRQSGALGTVVHIFGRYVVVRYDAGLEVQLPRTRFEVLA